MNIRKPLMVGAVIAALVGGSALPAFAAEGNTTATFTLEGGLLELSVQETVALTDGAAGDVSIAGSLGLTEVTDSRGGLDGWVATATSGGFASSTGGLTPTVSDDVMYDSGVVGSTGIATVESEGPETLNVVSPVVTATAVSGNNAAAWTPTITVALPTSSLAGLYTGVVTTSVL